LAVKKASDWYSLETFLLYSPIAQKTAQHFFDFTAAKPLFTPGRSTSRMRVGASHLGSKRSKLTTFLSYNFSAPAPLAAAQESHRCDGAAGMVL
jgi:hypothetical protein